MRPGLIPTIPFYGNDGRVYNMQVKTFDRTASDLYVDAPLTGVSIAYKNADYIADLCVPRIPVKKETGLVFKMGMENFRIMDLQRGDKAKSKRSGYTVDTDTTYRLFNYALSDVVTQGMRDQAQDPMSPDTDATENLTEILALNKEYKLASAMFNTGSGYFSGYTEALNAASSRYRWDVYTDSTPVQDVAYAMNKIRTNSGATSDIAVVIGGDVWPYLQEHPDLLEKITYSQIGVVTEELVKRCFQIDNFYVGKAMYDTANEGQTSSLASVWGKYALVYHRGRPTVKTAACAALVHGGNWVRKWTDQELQGATVVEVQEAFQEKLLSPRSGYLFSTVIS